MNDHGLRLYPGHLGRDEQLEVLKQVLSVVSRAPYYRPSMPRSGRPFAIEMTNAGPLGWVSSKEGYRYQSTHPESGCPWPEMPAAVLAIWRAVAGYAHDPECCLINRYLGDKAKLGLHRDEDEDTFEAPVVSVSFGNTCIFRVGGPERRSPTRSFRLSSGDVMVLSGASRLYYHGVDRVLPGSSTLIEGGGRINLTLRRVTLPQG